MKSTGIISYQVHEAIKDAITQAVHQVIDCVEFDGVNITVFLAFQEEGETVSNRVVRQELSFKK